MPHPPSRGGAKLGWAAAGGILALAVGDAVRLRWVSDDAFISFRYAANLVDGLGLVFNAGERVEGFSNFLWTLLLTPSLALGADPVAPAQVLGIVFYAATLGLLVVCTLRRRTFRVPVAALGLALHLHARIFATGGLETALFTFLVTATVTVTMDARGGRGYALASCLALLAALTRPDGAIFLLWPLLGALIQERRPSSLTAAVLPAGVLGGLYLAWKLHYYGEILPNTFYAKSASEGRYPQGLLYLRLYFQTYWPLLAGLLAPLVLLRPGREVRGLILSAGACLAYLLFVAHVGGDFMFARFALPVTPLLLLQAETLCAHLAPASLRWGVALVLLAGLAPARTPAAMFHLTNPTGIVEERAFYPRQRVEEARRAGAELERAFAGVPVRVAIYGSQAMLAYYARFPYVLEAHTGLTDREIARRPLPARGRVGHEKTVGLAYLRTRDIDFVFGFGLFPVRPPPERRIQVGSVSGAIVRARPQVLEALRGRPGLTLGGVDW
ncbi:MAG TPA: hypothetical protein VFO11_07335 [Candidatus Polarisedimenticolaceae bacterium]|nr:hypothetical protein [Candidatus Polarisedimenticolaceae bacterium]